MMLWWWFRWWSWNVSNDSSFVAVVVILCISAELRLVHCIAHHYCSLGYECESRELSVTHSTSIQHFENHKCALAIQHLGMNTALLTMHIFFFGLDIYALGLRNATLCCWYNFSFCCSCPCLPQQTQSNNNSAAIHSSFQFMLKFYFYVHILILKCTFQERNTARAVQNIHKMPFVWSILDRKCRRCSMSERARTPYIFKNIGRTNEKGSEIEHCQENI